MEKTQVSQAERLAVIEEVLTRLEKGTGAQLNDLFSMLREIKSDWQKHLQETAERELQVKSLSTLVNKHEDDLHGKDGAMLRIEKLEDNVGNAKKVIWEVLKPALYVFGVAFMLLIGSLGLFIYKLGDFVSALGKMP